MNLNETQIQLFGLAMIFYVVLTLGFNSFFDLIVGFAFMFSACRRNFLQNH